MSISIIEILDRWVAWHTLIANVCLNDFVLHCTISISKLGFLHCVVGLLIAHKTNELVTFPIIYSTNQSGQRTIVEHFVGEMIATICCFTYSLMQNMNRNVGVS